MRDMLAGGRFCPHLDIPKEESIYAREGSKRLFLSLSDDWQKYDYIVALPRRCFNYAFIHNSNLEKTEKKPKRMISDIALLGAVRELAICYLEKGVLPKVLFVDDVVLHGFALNKKIEQYVRALMEEIKIQSEGTEISTAQLRKTIFDQIDIRVLIQKDNKLLMSEELGWKVWAVKIVNVLGWHRLSSDVCDYLRKSGVAMTSFVISAYTSNELLQGARNGNWNEIKYSFENELNKGNVQQIVFCKEFGKGVLSTVRLYASSSSFYFVPFVFHGAMELHGLQQVFGALAALMQNKGLFHFAEKMRNGQKEKNPYVLGFYVQMAEMLLGQIALSCFLYEYYENVNTKFQYDWEKISLNFDAESGVQEWQRLCATQWTDLELCSVCSILPSFIQTGSYNFGEEADDDIILERSINSAYKCGIAHLCDTEDIINERRNANDSQSFFEKILNDKPSGMVRLEEWFKEVCPHPTVNVVHKALCVMLYLIDNGFMALRMDDTSDTQIGIGLCHTELTTSIYKAMIEEEWNNVRHKVSACRWAGISYEENLPKLLCKEGDSIEKQERVRLIGTTLSNYPQLYTELLTW